MPIKKKNLETELERVKNNREKLASEIQKLQVEQGKRKLLETELEQIKTVKEKLTEEIDSLKKRIWKSARKTFR